MGPNEYRVLTRDVEAPRPDRRQIYDWRALPIWKAGTKLEIVWNGPRTPNDTERMRREVRTPGRWSRKTIADFDDRFALLIEASAPDTPSLDRMLNERQILHEDVVTYLWEQGRITAADLDAVEQRVSDRRD